MMVAAQHRAAGAKHPVIGSPQSHGAVDAKEMPTFRVHTPLRKVFQERDNGRSVLSSPLSNSRVLVPLVIDSHGTEHVVLARDQTVQMDDQQCQMIKALGRQSLQLLNAFIDKLAADAGFADSWAFAHLKDHSVGM